MVKMPDLTPPTMMTGSMSAGMAAISARTRSGHATFGMAGKLLRWARQPA